MEKWGGPLYKTVASKCGYHSNMTTPSNTITYDFPLIDLDDAAKYSLIFEKFKRQRKLVRVEVVPHDQQTNVIVYNYMAEKRDKIQSKKFLTHLVENYGHVTFRLIIKS